MTLPTPFSYTQEAGDGSETSFSFAWDYISKADVRVYLDTTLVNSGSGASEWQWDGDKKIKMGTAPTSAQTLTIRRVTPEDKQIVPWTDGSHLIADDLNTSDKQWLYLIQEHHDMLMRIIYGLEPIPGPGLPADPFGMWNRLARHADSDKGTTDEKAQTIDSVDQLAGDASTPQNGVDAYVMTLGAISSRLDVIIGTGATYPGGSNVGQAGKLRIDNTGPLPKIYYWDTGTTAWVEIKGTSGSGATVDVGTTTTLAAGSAATVGNSGTTTNAIFDFGIPKGDKGDPGDGVEYKGPINPTTAAPSQFSSGDFYVSTAAGNALPAWTGLTVVAVNDRLIWNENTSQWDRYSQAWIQSNWTESDSAAPAFIENKPQLGTMASKDDAPTDAKQYGRQNGAWTQITNTGGTNIGYTAAADKGTITSSTGTDATVPLADNTNAGLFTAAEKTKLGGLAQSDWNATSGGAEILNKPAIPAVTWKRTTGTPNYLSPNVSADEVRATAPMKVRQVYGDGLILSGGTTVPRMDETNYFLVTGAITVGAPTGLKVGQTGLFIISAAVAGWNTVYKWPGGTAPTSYGASTVVPFFVQATNTVLMGNLVKGIA
jgi:hypothetical protein